MVHRLTLPILALVMATAATVPGIGRASEAFPTYPCLEANIAFWEDVYSRYSTRQGVLHDEWDLSLVYGAIELLPSDHPRRAEENRRRIRAAKALLRERLLRLARDTHRQDDPEDRRIAECFGPEATAQTFRAAAKRIRCQVGQKDRFREGLIRSGRYVEAIRDVFRDQGMPEELAFLPHVESSFDHLALSKSGAAGMWQFMPSTGRRFLRIDDVVDERRNPILAARAAAALLSENLEKLGSWPLAVTAYNHGTEGMVRAKRRHGDFETILRDYRSRAFGFASRNFYAQFLAALSVAGSADTHFPDVVPASTENTRTYRLEGFAALKDLAAHFACSPDRLAELNPSLQAAVIAGDKRVPMGFALTLPARSGPAWAMAPPASILASRQLPSRLHRIRKGETLIMISKRNRVDLNALLAANGIHRHTTIYPGQVLKLPLDPRVHPKGDLDHRPPPVVGAPEAVPKAPAATPAGGQMDSVSESASAPTGPAIPVEATDSTPQNTETLGSAPVQAEDT